MSRQTPSQTVGPYFHYGMAPDAYGFKSIVSDRLAGPDVAGTPIRVTGRILDGDGVGISDALLEVWQADGEGRFRTADYRGNDGFTGFGRIPTDETGRYLFRTIMPGVVEQPDGLTLAPHITMAIHARGLLSHAFTRMYFEDRAMDNSFDPVFSAIPEDRRETLLAARDEGVDGFRVYTFDIRLQGDNETAFLDI